MKRAVCVVMVCAMLLGGVPANASTFSEDVANVAYDTIVGAIIGGIVGAVLGVVPDPYAPYHETPSFFELVRDGIAVGSTLGFLSGLSKAE